MKPRCSPVFGAAANSKTRVVAAWDGAAAGEQILVRTGSSINSVTDLKGKTILMAKGTMHPECFHVEDGAQADAWISVKHNLTSFELEKELATSGWTFFFMAGTISATAFGFDRAKRMRAALQRLINGVKLQRCNCLQIDDVETRSFLGMPCVSISAHLRHLQKGPVFHGGQRGV